MNNQAKKISANNNLSATAENQAYSWLNQVLVLIFLLVLATSSVSVGKWVESGMGKVEIKQVTFLSQENLPMEAKVYRPKWVDKQHPGPAVLALHGYQADKESTRGFGAVELARRGFVVVAFDHYGHGRSTSHGVAPKILSGAGSALSYLQNLPFVDRDRIGVFGHSTGSIFSLALAKNHPEVKAIVALSGEGGNPDIKQVKNYLLIQGKQEEIGPYREKTFPISSLNRHPARLAAFNLPADSTLQWNHTYGNFKDGSARRAALVSGTHLGVMLSPSSNREVVSWFNQALQAGKHGPHWVPAGNLIYYYQYLCNALGLFALLFCLIPLTSLLLGNSLEKTNRNQAASAASETVQSQQKAKAVSVKNSITCATQTSWVSKKALLLFLGLSTVISIPLYMWCTQFGGGKEPLAKATNWFPLQMGNGIIYWLLAMTLVSVAKLLIDLKVKKTYSWSQVNQTIGLSVNGHGGRLFGYVTASLGFLIVAVTFIYLLTGADIRLIWPFFSILTAERILILPQYFLLILFFFVVVNGMSASFTFFRVTGLKPATQPADHRQASNSVGFWKYYAYMSTFAVAGLVILWLFHFLPLITGQGPGMDLVGLPNYGGRWMMMIFVLVPQFLVMTAIYCWVQLKTRSVWAASALTAAIFSWVLVGGQVGAF